MRGHPTVPIAMAEPTVERDGLQGFPLRVAAVDVGSNALRFVAAEFSAAQPYAVLENLRVPVRLGHSTFVTREMDAELIEHAVEALRSFRQRMDELGVEHHRAVATSAVRESRNSGEFLDRVRQEVGIHLEPITGLEEGRLVWVAIRSRVPLAGQRFVLVDLGGGSVEVSLVEAGTLAWTESLPLGTVRLLEKLEHAGEEPGGSNRSLRLLIQKSSAALVAQMRSAGPVRAMLATGGNAEALADVAGIEPDSDGVRLLTLSRLRELIEHIASLSVRERIDRLMLREDRADVILPAAIVYERLASIADTETILIPGVGLKEGILLDLVDDLLNHHSHEEEHARKVEEGALAFGRRYGFDEAHARQVTRMSLAIFDALEGLHNLTGADRRILLAAAMLHDVGKVVATRKHHRHSHYLIRHADLPGLTQHEVKLTALVARYHRSTRPKRSHKRYGKLDSADRKRVKTLTALLRVGDALDQEHAQQVTDVRISQDDDHITLQVYSRRQGVLEEWSFKRKGKLFERVFGRDLRVVRTVTAPSEFTRSGSSS